MTPRRCVRHMVLWGSLLGLACSERPAPVILVWDRYPSAALPVKAGFTGVVAWSRDEAIAVGYRIPEFLLLARAVSFRYADGTWTQVPMLGHEDASVQIFGADLARDGTVWACGSLQPTLEATDLAQPVVFHYANGSWTEVSLAELGDLTGNLPRSIAVSRTGGFELRIAGERSDRTGFVLRYDGTHWSRIAVPAPGDGIQQWGLLTVGCSPYGVWYAAGNTADTAAAAVFADRGAGFVSIPPPPVPAVQFQSVAFDAVGDAWFAANRTDRDLLEGHLLHLRGTMFEDVPIVRRSTGPAQLFGIGFNAEGYGWTSGGHTPDDPFFAGNDGGATWTEMLAEHEAAGGAATGEQEQGGEILSVAVVAKDAAFGVGRAEEQDVEGNTEIIARIFRLLPRPLGETDKASPVAP